MTSRPPESSPRIKHSFQPVLHHRQSYYFTTSNRFTCDAAPLGGVAVTTSGYDPGGVALPLGDFARLLHADIPTPKIISNPNETAHRGCLLYANAAPHSDNATSNSPRPVPNPPGVGTLLGPSFGTPFGTNPLQNVFTTIATLVVVPFNVTELGTILQVMLAIGLVQLSCTVPVNPVWPVSTRPNTPLPPGTVFTVGELPGPTEMITGVFPLLNVAVTAVAAVTVTTQVPVPEHPPPVQPANVEPSAGNAVNVTAVPLAKLAEHVVGQLIPAGALVTIPVPVPASLTVNAKLFVVLLNVAVTAVAAVTVTTQVPVPEHPPPVQPANVEPSAGNAVSVTAVPLAKLAEQVVGQLIPAGALVTVPVPVPASLTVKAKLFVVLLNVAVTAVAAVTVTTQVPVPEHPPPLQPANVEPAAAAAVSVTAVPLAKLAEHVVGQLIPAGALVTVPFPVPTSLTVSAKLFVFVLNVAVTAVAAVTVTIQVPVPEHPPPVQPANVEPFAADAVSVTAVPLAKFAEHVVGQLIPAGALVTVPVPVPTSLTVSAKLFVVLNVAVTVTAPLTVTTQVPGPLQPPPLQPANVEPEFAVALSVTDWPLVKPAVHVLGQLIPLGLLVTVPVPVPASSTVRLAPPAPVAKP